MHITQVHRVRFLCSVAKFLISKAIHAMHG